MKHYKIAKCKSTKISELYISDAFLEKQKLITISAHDIVNHFDVYIDCNLTDINKLIDRLNDYKLKIKELKNSKKKINK